MAAVGVTLPCPPTLRLKRQRQEGGVGRRLLAIPDHGHCGSLRTRASTMSVAALLGRGPSATSCSGAD